MGTIILWRPQFFSQGPRWPSVALEIPAFCRFFLHRIMQFERQDSNYVQCSMYKFRIGGLYHAESVLY